MSNLKDRLLAHNFELSKLKKDNYETCKIFADCVNAGEGGLSKRSKDEIYDIVQKLTHYKSQLKTENYKTFTFGESKIKLDDEQHEYVVSKPDSHVRIIAGAGSGKTTTILCRIKYLVDNYTVPKRILVLTFNVDACGNLKKRLGDLFGFNPNVDVRTIDSFCAFILWRFNLNNTNSFAGQNVYNNMSLSELGIRGEKMMLEYGKEISREYDYVFFDEFQDVNNSQFNILKIFAENNCYLTVIGDDCQNIYQWRGSNNFYIINFDKIIGNDESANPKNSDNILNEKDKNNVKTYAITTNYRSIPNIVHMANESIRNNKIRLDKNMKPCDLMQEGDGDVKLLVYKTRSQQFDQIIETIKDYVNTYGYEYDDFAILSRNGGYLKNVEERLQKENIPFIAMLTDKTNYDEKKPTIQKGKLTVTTIHRSKGLEWRCVFMIGLCDNQFPSHMNNNIKNIEEERRLFYVGITRAKNYLYFSANASEVPLTRFIEEIYEDYVIVENHTKIKDECLFGSNDKNDPKKEYGVTEIIKLLQGEQLEEMRYLDLIPDIRPIETEPLAKDNVMMEKLTFNSQIKDNYFESDFGEFCDRLMTRYIMIDNKQELQDIDTEYIINGVNLTEDEMVIYNDYDLENLFIKIPNNNQKIIDHLKKTLIDKDGTLFKKVLSVCNKIKPNTDVRRIETYPSIFIDILKASYKNYVDPNKKCEAILKHIYYTSLCRKFIGGRKRLVYRDIFDIFMKDFDPIHDRIKDYASHVKGRDILCKVTTQYKYKIGETYVNLDGEVDMVDLSTNSIIDFKCSESDMKVEWFIQVLLYYSLLLLQNQITKEDITKLCVFNVMSGKFYEFVIPENYDSKGLIDYVGKLIEKDLMSVRDYEKMDIDFLKGYGKNNDSNDFCRNNETVDINSKYGFDLLEPMPLDNINIKNKYISFDVETGMGDIIQLGYVLYNENKEEIKRQNHYINDRLVDKMTYDVHGISTEYLRKHGKNYYDVMYEFLTDLNECTHIIGHNISADLKYMGTNMIKYKIHLSYDPFDNKQIFDTMTMGKYICNMKDIADKLKPPKLEELYKFLFKCDMINAHDALVDAITTAECYFNLIDNYDSAYFEKPLKTTKIKPVKEVKIEKKTIIVRENKIKKSKDGKNIKPVKKSNLFANMFTNSHDENDSDNDIIEIKSNTVDYNLDIKNGDEDEDNILEF